MENQITLFKGEKMEELLRYYFINLGYYVVRGIKYNYQGFEITDIDLFLYGRSSSLTRQRINIDIKNKKSPQAFERILWANGLKKLLGLDSCIVATTDHREIIHSYGKLHNTVILDGVFLSKLRTSYNIDDRFTEEEILRQLTQFKSFKTFNNKDWRYVYEQSKSRLLTELDFSGFNSTLQNIHYFVEKILVNQQSKEVACRMVYILVSHLLIIIDFILKDIAFLDQPVREAKLSEGFRFGNLGREGIESTVNLAVRISGYKSVSSLLKQFDNLPTDILKEFFAKNDIAKNSFSWAKEFEVLGFKKSFSNPNLLKLELKSVISILLDYLQIERKTFFSVFD
jgi:hypothetical protein